MVEGEAGGGTVRERDVVWRKEVRRSDSAEGREDGRGHVRLVFFVSFSM